MHFLVRVVFFELLDVVLHIENLIIWALINCCERLAFECDQVETSYELHLNTIVHIGQTNKKDEDEFRLYRVRY